VPLQGIDVTEGLLADQALPSFLRFPVGRSFLFDHLLFEAFALEAVTFRVQRTRDHLRAPDAAESFEVGLLDVLAKQAKVRKTFRTKFALDASGSSGVNLFGVLSKVATSLKSFRTIFAVENSFRGGSVRILSPDLLFFESSKDIFDIFKLLFDRYVQGDSQLGQNFGVRFPIPQEPSLRLRFYEGQTSTEFFGELEGVKIGTSAF